MGKFDADRFKTQLRLAKCRIENLLKQHRNASGGRRREIANLLQSGHEDRARVNVKYLIRDDYLMEAYEMLLTSCDDLIQSAGLIAREKTLEQDLVPPAKSLLYACGRIDAPELDRLKEQLETKFGKDFVDVNSELGKTNVDPTLIVKLSIRTPDVRLVNKYLTAIAQIFNVPWEAPAEEPLLNEAVDKNVVPSPMPATLPPSQQQAASSVDFSSPPPYSPDLGHVPPRLEESPHSHQRAPSTASSHSSGHVTTVESRDTTSGVPDFEELTRRFQALKGDN